MRFSYRTKKGMIPSNSKKVNQDAYIINPNMEGKTFQHIFGVCDGHGPLGHHVSSFVKTCLPAEVEKAKELHQFPEECLAKAFDRVYQRLLGESKIDLNFSGSTVIVTYLLQNKLYCCNVGDSRAIAGRMNKNNGHWRAVPLSNDHKPDVITESQRIKSMNGRIDSFRAENGQRLGPLRVWLQKENTPGLAMTRSFGDLIASSVGVIPTPEIKSSHVLT